MSTLPTDPDGPTPSGRWKPWNVAPGSGFKVANDTGYVHIVQKNAQQFLVQTEFCYDDPSVIEDLMAKLRDRGMDQEAARQAVDNARTFKPSENPTDLASIPAFARWFENTYGLHTLAAILHDNLITEKSNGNVLGDDTLADRFFRQMLASVEVPYLKRWVLWTAVALRTRFKAGGLRMLSIFAWGALAVLGIVTLGWACLQWAGVAEPARFGGQSLGPAPLLWSAIALPLIAGGLWGKQYMASIFAAIAAPFILPAVLLALGGGAVYLVLERGFGPIGSAIERAVSGSRRGFGARSRRGRAAA